MEKQNDGVKLMNSRYYQLLLGTVFTILLIGLGGQATAHEPLFGLGPHTVGKYSWAVESEFERGDNGWSNSYELIYGLTPDLAVTVVAPYVFSHGERDAGLGDFSVRGKYRFLRQDFRNGSHAFALHGGVKFPSGSRTKLRGTGSFDTFAGVSFGLETRRHYAFTDVRYQNNGSDSGFERGNMFSFDAAYGIRPWQMKYLQPDFVILGEVLAESAGENTVAGVKDENSGGFVLSFARGYCSAIEISCSRRE